MYPTNKNNNKINLNCTETRYHLSSNKFTKYCLQPHLSLPPPHQVSHFIPLNWMTGFKAEDDLHCETELRGLIEGGGKFSWRQFFINFGDDR